VGLEGWRPDKGLTQPGVHVHKVLDLSHAQCDALAELAASMKPHHRMFIQQTRSDSGGTHLYVRLADNEFHVALNGKVQVMGVVDSAH
jgi:hypothetical protein